MLIKRSSYTEIYPPSPTPKKKKSKAIDNQASIYIYIDHLFFEFPGYTKAYL